MTRFSTPLVILAFLTCAGCASAPAHNQNAYLTDKTPAQLAWEDSDNGTYSDVQLELPEIVATSEKTIFLAGAYRNNPGPVCSALLVSRDGGFNWEPAGPIFIRCEMRHLTAIGSHVWVVATFTYEGAAEPQCLLISSDEGRTWRTVSLEFTRLDQGLNWIDTFDVQDERHVLMATFGAGGLGATYASEDGGLHWKTLWRFKDDPITTRRASGDENRSLKSSPCVWVSDDEICIQARPTHNHEIVIETRHDGSKAGWELVRPMPSTFKARPDKLEIVPSE